MFLNPVSSFEHTTACSGGFSCSCHDGFSQLGTEVDKLDTQIEIIHLHDSWNVAAEKLALRRVKNKCSTLLDD